MKTLAFYQTRGGKIPFTDWLSSLRDVKATNIIESRLYRLRFGHYGDWKYIGNKVKELRVDYAPGYRIYFVDLSKHEILILYAGKKHSQQRDISLTHKFWQTYKEEFIDETETSTIL